MTAHDGHGLLAGARDREREQEVDEKVARLLPLLAARELDAVIVSTQPGFSWLSAGGTNGIDLSREDGAGALLVARDGRRFLLANAIERPRLEREELAGLGFAPHELPWQAGPASPTLFVETARRLLGAEARIGADGGLAGAQPLDGPLATLRHALTPGEVARIAQLGQETGEALGAACRELRPGQAELDVARAVTDALAARRLRTVVCLVAADARLDAYRHPVPTEARWQRRLMVAVCARHHGLTVSATRLLSAGPPEPEFARRTRACAAIFARVVLATRPGAAARSLYEEAVAGYAAAGFAGEEDRHHQGGACGYRTRDWLAHPASTEVVRPFQAFAWNPTIAGTKVEETILATPEGPRLLTTTPGWPTISVEARAVEARAADAAGPFEVPGILEVG